MLPPSSLVTVMPGHCAGADRRTEPGGKEGQVSRWELADASGALDIRAHAVRYVPALPVCGSRGRRRRDAPR